MSDETRDAVRKMTKGLEGMLELPEVREYLEELQLSGSLGPGQVRDNLLLVVAQSALEALSALNEFVETLPERLEDAKTAAVEKLEMRPGDVLVVKVPSEHPDTLDEFRQYFESALEDIGLEGVRVRVVTDRVSLVSVRRGEDDDG